ncbi:MAG: hypothetical protein ACLPSW_08405 [Roseiarcus sp.]
MTTKNISTLKLEGAKADFAVDCMRKAGVMPSKSAYDVSIGTTVKVDASGQVAITESGTNTGAYSDTDSVMNPADHGRPAEAKTPEVEVTGKIAENMRRKASACAFKSIGITP